MPQRSYLICCLSFKSHVLCGWCRFKQHRKKWACYKPALGGALPLIVSSLTYRFTVKGTS
jgi:hypothetical protein